MSRYWTMTLIGLGIAGASIVAIDWGIYNLVRTGTCASGGPYVSARPCPPGTGLHVMALVGGIFGGLIGIGLYAARGKGGRPSRVGLGLIMWSLLFVTIALATAVAAFGPGSDDSAGAKTTAVILGVIFLPMGLAPLPFALGSSRKQERARALVERGRRCPGEVVSVEDTGITINDNPRVRITVHAAPPGEAPFTVVKTTTVSRVSIPRRGDRCTVFYDPADRENSNGITFDEVPGVTPTPAPSPPAPAPAPAPTPPTPPEPATYGAPAPDDDESPLEKIERLARLRDRGLLTHEEFEAQKRRLLDEV